MIWEHRFLQFYSMMLNAAPEDLAKMEGSRYVKGGLDVTRTMPFVSPCLVTELLLRSLSLDSKMLLQNPVNTV